MFERFTSQSRRVVVLAQEEARELNHDYIGTEHLLLGLLAEGQGAAATGADVSGHHPGGGTARGRGIDRPGRAAANRAYPVHAAGQEVPGAFAARGPAAGDNYIGTGHLLLGLMHEGHGVAVKVLEKLGANPGQLRERVMLELENQPEDAGSAG